MSQSEPTSVARPKKGRWPRRVVAVLLGLIVGVGVAEAAFWVRDEGAFPHVNFYQPDPELGVRLIPDATMRFKIHDNPMAEITVNSAGYRGPEWSDAEGQILVVGDSQVFGLGVGDDETMAAQLGEISGRPVINGGVPTYGPREYTAVVREVLEERPVSTVVYVVNMSNDFFEAERPNTGRHAVWDGWAVRAEFAPETITQFPGRELLFRRSHAFYAARRWFNQELPDTGATPSEGSWNDLVATGSANRTEAEERAAREAQNLQLDRLRFEQALREADATIDNELDEHIDYSDDYDFPAREIATGHPGDIIYVGDSEEARPIALTAQMIRRAVRVREALMQRHMEDDPDLAAVVTRAERLREGRQRARGSAAARAPSHAPTSVDGELARLKALCDEHGAELLVVALPLDVVVSADEWAKYGQEPVDMEPTRVLLQDLVASAESLGARGLDATDALRAAEPGAFLNGDLHMTAKGQRALAEAVAERLTAPPPLRLPDGGLPEGRSHLPSYDEWVQTPEVTVRGSSAAKCETVRVREWLRLTCIAARRSTPTAITGVTGAAGDATVHVSSAASDLIVPLIPGQEVRADFHWSDRSQTLEVTWEGEEPQMRLTEPRASEHPSVPMSATAERMCECHAEVVDERACGRGRYNEPECDRKVCTHAFGNLSEACLSTYGDDCAALLRCARADATAPPACGEGEVLAGGTQQCFVACDDAHPCEAGECTPWRGGGICTE